MNTITSTNKDFFKSHINYYSSQIDEYLQAPLTVIDNLFSTKSSGLSTDARSIARIYPIKSGVTTITSSVNLNQLIYFPSYINQPITVGIGTTSYEFTVNSNNTLSVDGTTYGIDDSIQVNNKSLIVRAFGGLLLQGSNTPTYSITPSALTASEGSSVSFTVNTGYVSAGTTLYYSTGGASVDTADFSDSSLTGSFNIVSTGSTTGIATFTRTIATDFSTEPSESFYIEIRTNSISGTIVATSSIVNIVDVVPSLSVTSSSLAVNEGNSVTFTVSGTNVPDGTYYYSIEQQSGVLTASDFSPASLTGSFPMASNSGTITITLSNDFTSEGNEQFYLNIRKDSVTGTILTTSNIIVVADTSQDVGSNANGLTFGPVQVNRDNGNPANASDWYTICDLDNVPDGSSIALFIDNSGSLTTAKVQASYDLLVSKLAARNITITTVTNGSEDWITPFLTNLP